MARKRITVLKNTKTPSVEERMMFRFRDEYKCSIKEAWNMMKLYRMGKEMSRLTNA